MKISNCFGVGVCLLSLLGAQLPSCAQTLARPDWQVLKSIPGGRAISVRSASGRTYCRFANASEDMLTCEQKSHLNTGSISFRRDQVQQVRFERPAASAATGTALGAGIGVGIGAAVEASYTRGNDDPGLAPALFATLGALAGWIAGRHVHLIHGAVVYQL